MDQNRLLSNSQIMFFKNPRLTVVEIEKYIEREGIARLNSDALKAYIEGLAMRASSVVDYDLIESVITFFVAKKGIKINAPITKAISFDRPAANALQLVASMLENKYLAKEVKKRATFLATAALENSAGFSLQEKEKVELIKNILEFKPEYIKILIAKKFCIEPDFKIDGKPLAQYARDCKVDAEIVGFIESQPKKIDHVLRKKRKILQDPIILDGKIADGEVIENFVKEMKRGVNTQGQITLVTSKKGANYMMKPDCSFSRAIANHYGAQILRVVSAKDFAVKDPAIVKIGFHQNPGKVKYVFATKIDRAFSGQRDMGNFLSGEFGITENPSGAAYFGASSVFGERDWNMLNGRISAKHGRLIAIDTEPLFNGIFAGEEIDPKMRVMGSIQSLVLLKKLSGASSIEVFKFYMDLVGEATKINQDDKLTAEDFCKKINKLQTSAIDNDLLKKIKSNISANPRHKAEFMAFMRGVERAIAIAEDGNFLDDLGKKYQAEIGDDAFVAAKKCRAALVSNAQESKKIYVKYLEFYKELQEQEKVSDGGAKTVAAGVKAGVAKAGGFLPSIKSSNKVAPETAKAPIMTMKELELARKEKQKTRAASVVVANAKQFFKSGKVAPIDKGVLTKVPDVSPKAPSKSKLQPVSKGNWTSGKAK